MNSGLTDGSRCPNLVCPLFLICNLSSDVSNISFVLFFVTKQSQSLDFCKVKTFRTFDSDEKTTTNT